MDCPCNVMNKKHIRNILYFAIHKGYIENEVDMNERGTCNSKCSEYTYAESKGCYKDLFCAKQPQCKEGQHTKIHIFDQQLEKENTE